MIVLIAFYDNSGTIVDKEFMKIKSKNMKKAVITFDTVDEYGETVTCNMVESLNVTLDRLNWRIEDFLKKYKIKGNIILQFVEEDNG